MKTFDFAAIAKQFWDEGYVVLEDFFTDELMDLLHERILDHFEGRYDNILNDEFTIKSKCQIVPWFPQREGDHTFDAVEELDEFKRITEAVLLEGWQSQYCMVMFSGMGTTGQAWHQDCPPEKRTLFNLNRLIYTREIVDEIGGQVMVVPRTHLNGALPAGDPNVDFDDQVTLYPKKGTLVLLHGHCWHRVMPVHGKYRVSTNFRAAPKNVPDDVTDICVYRNMRYQFSTNSVVEDRWVPAEEAVDA